MEQIARADWLRGRPFTADAFLNAPMRESAVPQLMPSPGDDADANGGDAILRNQRTGLADLILECRDCVDVSQSLYAQLAHFDAAREAAAGNSRGGRRRLVMLDQDGGDGDQQQQNTPPATQPTQSNRQNAPNFNWNRANRLLRLTLTDGHREIAAMERQPIAALSPLTPLGYKARLFIWDFGYRRKSD